MAVVRNRSAVGEQYVDLQPTRAGEPFLEERRRHRRWRTPTSRSSRPSSSSTSTTSSRASTTRTSAIVIDELGQAFDDGAGQSLQQIIDSGNLLTQAAPGGAARDQGAAARRRDRAQHPARRRRPVQELQPRPGAAHRHAALQRPGLPPALRQRHRQRARGHRPHPRATAPTLPVLFDNFITLAQVQKVRLPALQADPRDLPERRGRRLHRRPGRRHHPLRPGRRVGAADLQGRLRRDTPGARARGHPAAHAELQRRLPPAAGGPRATSAARATRPRPGRRRRCSRARRTRRRSGAQADGVHDARSNSRVAVGRRATPSCSATTTRRPAASITAGRPPLHDRLERRAPRRCSAATRGAGSCSVRSPSDRRPRPRAPRRRPRLDAASAADGGRRDAVPPRRALLPRAGRPARRCSPCAALVSRAGSCGRPTPRSDAREDALRYAQPDRAEPHVDQRRRPRRRHRAGARQARPASSRTTSPTARTTCARCSPRTRSCSEGKVLEAALVRFDEDSATALVVVDATVRNTAEPRRRGQHLPDEARARAPGRPVAHLDARVRRLPSES